MASATPLTPEEALAAALGNSPRLAPGKAPYTLAWQGENAGVYVFNRAGGGFVVTSADTDAPALLLGYSDSSTFDPANMPPAMRAMLDQFAAGAYESSPLTAATRESIAPLVKTKWNQSVPYNLKCPTNAIVKTMTGCMATAMAQVMKRWNYPTKGSGYASVQYAGNKWSFDYENTEFDWANMLDEYENGAYTTTQADAVATLMYGVGVACDMTYGDQASSATTIPSAQGMINHLGYDKGLRLNLREFYPLDEWNQMLYDELKAGRPILYTGASAAGGHAFVCDGYDGTDGDYFHINWGWGGMSDGYFLVTNLDPGNQGIGGGVGAFSWQQTVMTNIKPAEEGSEYYELIGQCGKFKTTDESYTRGQSISFTVENDMTSAQAGFFNFSLISLKIKWGVKIVDEKGTATYVDGQSSSTFDPNTGVRAYNVLALNFPDAGTYTVTPAAYVDNSHWVDLQQEVSTRTVLKLTIDGDNLTFEPIDEALGIKIDKVTIDPADVILNNENTKITLDASAVGEPVTMQMRPALLKERNNQLQILAYMPWKSIDIAADESAQIVWDDTFDAQLNEGAYKLAILKPYANQYLFAWGPVDVYVADEIVEPEIKTSSISLNGKTVGNAAMRLNVSQPTTVKGTINCTRGHYIAELAALVTDADNKVVASVSDETITIDLVKGKKQDFEFTGSLSELTEGATYKLNLATIDGQKATPIVAPIEIIIEKNASIATIAIDPNDSSIEFYDMTGRRITTPESGHIYIVRTSGETFKAIAK